MLPHPLTNFEIQKYYQNESIFNAVYSRDNLYDKIKDGAYIINFDEYFHCVKSVQILSFFWSVFSRIQSECGKIRTRKKSVFGHVLHSV